MQFIVQMLFLCVRGIVLSLVLPLAILIWLFVAPDRALSRRPYLGPMRLASWLDLNASTAIARIVLRSLGRKFPFTPWSQIDRVEHRTQIWDLW